MLRRSRSMSDLSQSSDGSSTSSSPSLRGHHRHAPDRQTTFECPVSPRSLPLSPVSNVCGRPSVPSPMFASLPQRCEDNRRPHIESNGYSTPVSEDTSSSSPFSLKFDSSSTTQYHQRKTFQNYRRRLHEERVYQSQESLRHRRQPSPRALSCISSACLTCLSFVVRYW